MIFKHSKVIVVEEIAKTERFARVTCTIPNYKNMIEHVQVGESIATKETFDMNFHGFTSKWKIIFFPKGQFDFGVASEDCRAYIKLMSCDRHAELKINIKIFLKSSSAVLSASHGEDVSVFAVNDNVMNWAGPFRMKAIEKDRLSDTLILKYSFKLMSSENKDMPNLKRSLREDDSSPPARDPLLSSSKKTRLVSPPADDKEKHIPEHNTKANEVSPKDPPNPFGRKSPVLYGELTHNRSDGTVKNLSHEQRKKFTYRMPSQKFTPAERSEVQKLPYSYGNLSLTRSGDMSEQNSQSKTWISSQCLQVADLFVNKVADKNDAEAESKDENESETIFDNKCDKMTTIKKRIKYFENRNKRPE